VATGTASNTRSISSSEKPCSTSRSRELSWMSVCDHAARAGRAGDGRAVQRVDLLRLDPRHRRRLVLRVARGDRDLGGTRVLPLAHALGDVLGERLGAERALAQDHLADRLVDDLFEARHVRALLARPQVDEAFELRGEQLLAPVVAHADDLLDGRDADAGERELQRRELALDVLYRDLGGPIFVHSGKDRCPFARPCAQKASRTAQGFSKTAGEFRATKQASAQGTASGGAPIEDFIARPRAVQTAKVEKFPHPHKKAGAPAVA
jgi:hypothetical protein